MGNSFQTIDRFATGLARAVIRWRWAVLVAAIASAVLIGSGAAKLEFANNYRVFFSDENPELVAFEALVEAGSWAIARDKGSLRLEGKEYIVADGDVILFRFNV